jgi:hypothetical protein
MGSMNKKVVGEVRAYQASRLAGLGERPVTLGLKQGPASVIGGSSAEYWTMSASLIL